MLCADMNNKVKKAVILVSGGLDSATSLAYAKDQGFDCYALSFEYGQRHQVELESAKQVALSLGAKEHRIESLSIGNMGGSALTDKTIAVPDYQDNQEIPVTYVPARNTIFLSIALAWAEVLQARDIFIGVSAVDYSGYPDCRPEYIAAFEAMANLATKDAVNGYKIKIHAPLIELNKAETIQLGQRLGVDYAMTLSCYQPDEQARACAVCDSCVLRRKGFLAANIQDPTCYIP